jgi:hypothetical protein
MAYIFGDGCGLYSAAADLLPHWTSQSVSLVTGRYGGQAVSVSNTSVGASKTLSGSYSSLIIMADFKRNTNNGSSPVILRIQESATIHLDLRHNSDGTFTVTRNGTSLGAGSTSVQSVADNIWAHLQIKFTINDSTGSFTLRLNGNTNDIISLTNIDTQNGGTGLINNLGFICSLASNSVYWGNIVVFDTTGGSDLLTSEPRFYLLSPISEGFQQDFTPSTGTDNALTIDEVPQNGDTDYNTSSTPNALDLLNMADMSISNGTIIAVQSRVYARREDSGTREISPIFRISSTNYVRTGTTISNTYTWCTDIAETNPNTAAAWTIADINALQAGYKITI